MVTSMKKMTETIYYMVTSSKNKEDNTIYMMSSVTDTIFLMVAVTGLTPVTGYSYKAYIISSQGTSYTTVSTFTTLSNNADLNALALSSGTLSPLFASATTGTASTLFTSNAKLLYKPSTGEFQ